MSDRPDLERGAATLHVADALRNAIIRGTLAPGERIRQEQIGELTGASRAPVREALRMLSTEGLVTLVPNAGARVSSLSLDECQEIYRLRERVEPLLLRMSAPGLTANDLDRLDTLASQMAAVNDHEEFLVLDRAFHLSSYAGTQTAVLTDLVHRMWNRTEAYRRLYSRQMDERAQQIAHDEHRLIVASLRDGELESAENVLAGHIRRTRRRLSAHPEVFASQPALEKGNPQ